MPMVTAANFLLLLGPGVHCQDDLVLHRAGQVQGLLLLVPLLLQLGALVGPPRFEFGVFAPATCERLVVSYASTTLCLGLTALLLARCRQLAHELLCRSSNRKPKTHPHPKK